MAFPLLSRYVLCSLNTKRQWFPLTGRNILNCMLSFLSIDSPRCFWLKQFVKFAVTVPFLFTRMIFLILLFRTLDKLRPSLMMSILLIFLFFFFQFLFNSYEILWISESLLCERMSTTQNCPFSFLLFNNLKAVYGLRWFCHIWLHIV